MTEAGRIDGCGAISTCRRVVRSNALSPIFALVILQFLFCWHSRLFPLLYLRTEKPLPVVFVGIAALLRGTLICKRWQPS